ncbi:MAG: hypothetical protein ACIALR_03055 [Blastopirellula sp. JB062]
MIRFRVNTKSIGGRAAGGEAAESAASPTVMVAILPSNCQENDLPGMRPQLSPGPGSLRRYCQLGLPRWAPPASKLNLRPITTIA